VPCDHVTLELALSWAPVAGLLDTNTAGGSFTTNSTAAGTRSTGRPVEESLLVFARGLQRRIVYRRNFNSHNHERGRDES
jgi:hypothetical protein